MRRAWLALLLSGCFVEPLETAEVRLVLPSTWAQTAEGCARDAEGVLDVGACSAWLRLEAPEVREGPLGEIDAQAWTLELEPGLHHVEVIGFVGGEAVRIDGASATLRLEAGQVEALELELAPLPTEPVEVPEEAARVVILDVEARARFEAPGEGLRLPARRFELEAFDEEGRALSRWEVGP